jgi:hypothetical protein
MASTYVNDLRLNEMATGDASGSWGTVTNTNLELIGEAFSYGTETIGDADSTLTIADGAADAARSFYLKITSSVDLTTTRIVTLAPNTVSKVWMIENATTGSQVITIKQGSGATINVPNGQVKMISTDGAGSGGAVLDLLVDVDLTGTTTLVNLDVSGAVDIAGDLTLSAGGDGALRFTAASSVKVLDNDAAALVFEEADNAYMTFVTTDGSEAVKFDKALDINAATQIDATVTVGVDDTGYDVKFFGATAGAYMLWDESADDLILGGAAGLSVNSTALVTGVLTTTAATVSNGGGQFNGAINVGVDDTGYDVKFFGATTGKSLLWDESADSLTVAGNLSVDGGTIKLDGNYPVGTGNVALGDTALDSLDGTSPGGNNVAIGSGAGTAISTGANNVAVGFEALKTEDGNGNTTAIGYRALKTQNAGAEAYNVAVGIDAGTGLTTGVSNTLIGGFSGGGATFTGASNTAVGRNSLYVNTSGANNVAIGAEALTANTTASSNTAVGYQSLYVNTTGYSNTAVGYQSLDSNTTGAGNSTFGHGAGAGNTTGTNINIFGINAGLSSTTANNITAFGSDTLRNNTASNIAGFGSGALYTNTTGTGNTALGPAAYGGTQGPLGLNTTGSYNTAVGMQALLSNTTASNNTAVGYQAGYSNTTATNNTSVGYQAAYNTTTGEYNNAFGANDNTRGPTLVSNTTGNHNNAFGNGALCSNTTGSSNSAFGSHVLGGNTTASENSGFGARALFYNTTGTSNVAIGKDALYTNTTASNNTAVGKDAGYGTTGEKNTFIGYGSGASVSSGTKNTILGAYTGNQGGLDIRTASNNIVLSDGDGNPRAIYQNNGSSDFWCFNLSDADDPAVYSYTSGGGASIREDGLLAVARSEGNAANFNRTSNDGEVILISQNGTAEGTISVSGTTVSYNGGHLARWSQLADNTRDNTLLKGTVLTNLDQMAVWGDEDNEQLNCMAKSSVEGDANVAGVFVNWDNDDDVYTNDMNIAMTGDMIIRIAQGTTVARGDLLMSAGDGTAKPQGDDIVRSKTIAKVTSTHVSHTYDDGSFCVPCVLMAC